ncbi:MAG TPA: YjdF family protein [Thermotogota bacterium]|nr:YjdF family protein [Thermotogota bacterium]HPR94822.1 YjdF family protein [Thermotogota bacterium]
MCKLTVFFEDPFWVAFFEWYDEGELGVARYVFGAEPKEYEVYSLILKRYFTLDFSSTVQYQRKKELSMNPKRFQRRITRERKQTGVSTKAQEALRLERESRKVESKKKKKVLKEEIEKEKFLLKQRKKREKKRH